MDKVIDEIAQWLFFHDWDNGYTTMIYFSKDWQEGLEEWERERYRKEVKEILNIKVGNYRVAIVEDGAELPDIFDKNTTVQFPVRKDGYVVQQDMLRTGYVKEVIHD